MPRSKTTLFDPVVATERLHPNFEQLRTWPGNGPARWILDDLFQSFPDPDGNFLEQFQTTGYDARYFELYLFAYFSRSGFAVDRSRPAPDFLVSREGLTVAVEATTVNPPTSGSSRVSSNRYIIEGCGSIMATETNPTTEGGCIPRNCHILQMWA